MIRSHFFFLFSLITITALSGCNYSIPNRADGAAASGDQTIEVIPTGTIPSYKTVADGIITPKCLGCHSSAGGNDGGVNLETYNNVKAHLVSIDSAIKSGSMPLNLSLTDKEKEVFLSWIDAGGPLDAPTVATGPTTPVPTPAPTSTPTPVPTPTPTPAPTSTPTDVMPDPNKIDYKMVNANVIGPRCISCHSDGGGNSAGINLETYENVFNERNTIKSQISSGSMPLPRSRPLTDIQKQTILTWLNKGAPETVP